MAEGQYSCAHRRRYGGGACAKNEEPDDGEEILFFAMLANEYKERIETVSYINDGDLRKNVYDSIIFSYMAFATSIGDGGYWNEVLGDFLENHGLDFTYKETAIYATSIILWVLIRELIATGQNADPQTALPIPHHSRRLPAKLRCSSTFLYYTIKTSHILLISFTLPCPSFK
ncbi:hypothetical protein CRE_01272 [Caenorhabditis remanei]|uniref:Uncharacterized protein n=1 Tax=Caenorhabditis remanei TaxID=31234 RepID=E3N9P8_CAERE|nr:hypothetical protein CRE_01272 [Caenorhabditis remanei]